MSTLDGQTLSSLTRTAITGLTRYYANYRDDFHYTVRRDSTGHLAAEGKSVRYGAICQIGITEWLKHHPEDSAVLPDLYSRVRGQISQIDDLGDCALWVWAASAIPGSDLQGFVRRMLQLWPDQAKSCHSVELGWILKACIRVHDTSAQLRPQIHSLLEEVRERLGALFVERSGLFKRHDRPGLLNRVSGDIACFADQIYPIVALSDAAATLGDQSAKYMAGRAADRICELQGPLGQWLWHYDVPRNRVCEAYPVFSVHQHGMAPMALLAADAVTGKDHSKEIAKGVQWIWGTNEMGQNLVLQEDGVIWRDIERKEPMKFSRKVKSACSVLGIQPLGQLICAPFRAFQVNYECRPYELGWTLYAWANRHGDTI